MNRCFPLILLLMSLTLAREWSLNIEIAKETKFELGIGMQTNATEGFNPKVDYAAPPILPTGIFPYFPLEDSKYSYLKSLWRDIRAEMDSAKWSLVIHRGTSGVKITWASDSLPRGLFTIQNENMEELNGLYITDEDDTLIEIKYYKTESMELEPEGIKFNLDTPAQVKVIIATQNGKVADILELGYLENGIHRIQWDFSENTESTFFYAVIADGIQIAEGTFSPVMNK